MYQLFTLVIMWLTGSCLWPASWDSIVLYNPSLGKIQNSHYAFYRMCIAVAPSQNQKIVSQGAFMFNKLHSTEHSIINRLCIEWFCPTVASVNLSLLKVDRAKLCCLAAVIYFLRHVWLFCDPVHCSPLGSSVYGIFTQGCWSGLPVQRPATIFYFVPFNVHWESFHSSVLIPFLPFFSQQILFCVWGKTCIMTSLTL